MRYRVGYEDVAFAATQDPWHKVILCSRGHICPAGGIKLWACTNSRRGRAVRILMDKFRVVMDGDDGVNVEFDVNEWQEVFDLMGAKRR